jgi:hypothetical protein
MLDQHQLNQLLPLGKFRKDSIKDNIKNKNKEQEGDFQKRICQQIVGLASLEEIS